MSEHLSPYVDRLKCVGSVRRRRRFVGDIEFLAEPYFDRDLLGETTPIIAPVRAAVEELGLWERGAQRMMQTTDLLGVSGLKLDLYLVHPPADWWTLLGIRTGPRALGRYVATACRDRGYRVKGGHVRKGRERHPLECEADFFAIAGLECVPPPRRDEQARAVLRGTVRA